MKTREEIKSLILELARDFNADLDYKIDLSKGEAAGLFGEAGALDSLNLVAFVIAVEQALSDRFDISLALADEKAMSRHRTPFRTVGTLAEYISSRMAEMAHE